MRKPGAVVLTVLLAACAPLVRADEPKALDKPGDLAIAAALAEASRVEAELQASLDKVRAQRAAVESRMRDGSIDTRSADSATSETRIVNGVQTWAFPATGALIKGAVAGSAESWCTGTLIGCRTFLTANHCVNDDRSPAKYHVYLQSGGLFDVESISPRRDDYDFPQGDLAVLHLKDAVKGVTPIAVNTAVIANGTTGTIVGFGRSGGVNSDYGLKRTGRVVTAACDRPETTLLCWDYNAPAGVPGENSNTCNADSGGPLFLTAADGTLTVAGVTSGGSRSNCLTGDHAYDVDVRQFESWVREQAGADLGTRACGAVAPVGTMGTSVLGGGGRLTAGQAANFRFNVPAGVQVLRVALNAQDEPSTNVDLFVRRGAAAGPGSADCAADGPGNYGFCEFASPQAGPWFLQLKQGGSGDGDFQVAVTLLGARP